MSSSDNFLCGIEKKLLKGFKSKMHFKCSNWQEETESSRVKDSTFYIIQPVEDFYYFRVFGLVFTWSH